MELRLDQPNLKRFNGRRTQSNRSVNLLFREAVSISGRSGDVRGHWSKEACINAYSGLVKLLLPWPKIHGRSTNFNPVFGNVYLFMLHLRSFQRSSSQSDFEMADWKTPRKQQFRVNAPSPGEGRWSTLRSFLDPHFVLPPNGIDQPVPYARAYITHRDVCQT